MDRIDILLFLAIAATSFVNLSHAIVSPDVPSYRSDIPLRHLAAIESELSDSTVRDKLINAAALSTITIDAPVQNNPCGETFNVTGSIKCLEEYVRIADSLAVITLPYDNFTECNYAMEFSCGAVTTEPTPNIDIVTSDSSVLIDGSFDLAWVHRIEKNSPVVITLELPVIYRVDRLILDVETIPIAISVSSTLRGGPIQHIRTYQLAECPTNLDGPVCEQYFESKNRLIRLFSVEEDYEEYDYTNPENNAYEFVMMDKIIITFPGETTWKDYSIEHLIIREIYLEATCACKDEICATEINNKYPESSLAEYSCTCETEDIGGFYCEQCSDIYYNNTEVVPSGRCELCDCGPGALDGTCDSDLVCKCDPKLYDRPDVWDTKCNNSYISELHPQRGRLQGGTLVTITGGLLTQLSIELCIPTDEECTDCPPRDQMMVCRMSAGAAIGMVTLIRAPTVDGQLRMLNFTYTDSPEVIGLSPTESFASGGRALTLKGSRLDLATEIKLGFHITCLLGLPMEWTINQSCTTTPDDGTSAECHSINFCGEENKCNNRGITPAGDFCNKGNEESLGENSLGETSQYVTVKWLVYVDGIPINSSTTTSAFTITADPVLFEWENLLKVATSSVKELRVPGEKLNSGASFRDYRATTNGTELRPIRISDDGKELILQRPSNVTLGNTTVYLGNQISKQVGFLRIEDRLPWEIIVATVVVAALLIIIVPTVVVIWRRKSQQLSLEKNMLKLAYKGGDVRYVKHNGEFVVLPLGHLITDAQLLDNLKPFLIDKERLSLSTQLGSGQFGKVYKGAVKFDNGSQATVAAKTLKADSGITEETINGFLKEATLMSNFNHHNVLSLIGLVYSDGHMPIVVLPYMHRGDIRSLLHSDVEVFVLGDLLHFGMQIGRGMEYLADRRFIHRDLAARNCMVDNDYIVKIADFGLSHDIYEDDYYRVDEASTKPLPVKWMAIESLNSGKYTTHSDVWSFGIVMWELLTRGITPYPAVSNYEITTHLTSGARLTQPQYCPDIIYAMMNSCWLIEPTERPTFTELADKLAAILDESHYENRNKTKNIEGDYYLQPMNLEDFQELYVQLVE